MAHKYAYPVVDRALRNFLVFVLMILIIITVTVGIGIANGVLDMAAVTASLDTPLGIQMFLDAYAES